MAQQLIDDNGITVFVDDNGVVLFFDDFGNWLGDLGVGRRYKYIAINM